MLSGKVRRKEKNAATLGKALSGTTVSLVLLSVRLLGLKRVLIGKEVEIRNGKDPNTAKAVPS